jgi:hypothetical protein
MSDWFSVSDDSLINRMIARLYPIGCLDWFGSLCKSDWFAHDCINNEHNPMVRTKIIQINRLLDLTASIRWFAL